MEPITSERSIAQSYIDFDTGHYFWPALTPQARNELVTRALDVISGSGLDFDSITVTGMSGVSFGSILAFILDKPLVIVRRADSKGYINDGGHSHRLLEGQTGGRTLFVDDFLSSGRTFLRVKKAVEWSGGTVVGAYAYFGTENSFNLNETGNAAVASLEWKGWGVTEESREEFSRPYAANPEVSNLPVAA